VDRSTSDPAWYDLSRLIVELFREPDQHLGFIFGPITMGQVLSLPMVLVGITMLILGYYKNSPSPSPTTKQ
jgi:phosphatidylglycerol:prolipoprotein diacylglycerol transferase